MSLESATARADRADYGEAGGQEAETALLGAILQEPERLPDVAAVVSPADFADIRHERVMAAMIALAERGQAIDPLTIANTADAGGITPAFVTSLDQTLPDPARALDYAAIVAAAARKRRIGAAAAALARDPDNAEIAERLQRLMSSGTGAARVKALGLEQMLSVSFEPREWLIPGLLQERDLAMVHGWRGIGKTRLLHSLAYAVASGGRFLRYEAGTPRGVLLVDGETPREELQERLAGTVSSAEAEAVEPFRVLAADMQDEPLPSLSSKAGRKVLEANLDAVGLVILDNLSTLCATGDENSAADWEDWQAYLLDLRRRGHAVVLVHHDGKGKEQRGTSKHEDVLSTVLHLKRPSDYRAAEGARFEVHVAKGRSITGADAEPFEAHLTTDAEGRQTWTWRSLEDATLSRVKSLHADGLTQREIARELDIGLATVNRKLKAIREHEGSRE